MKISYHKIIILLIFILFGFSLNLKAQIDTLFINDNFESINLKNIAGYVNSSENLALDEIKKSDLNFVNKNKQYILINIEHDYGVVLFCVANKSKKKQDLIVEINNALINDILFFEKKIDSFKLLNKTGTDYIFNSRPINDRLFLYPISLQPNETSTYAFRFKNTKISLLIPATIWNKNQYEKHNKTQYLIIGVYYGLSFLSILLGLYMFILLRKKMYLLYVFYILSLGLYLFTYLGLYFQYVIDESHFFNKYIYVLFTVTTMVLFVLFSKKILHANEHSPKTSKFLNYILIIAIALRFGDFVLPDSVFSSLKPTIMRLWYLTFFIINFGLIFLIIKSYKHQKRITLFYGIAFSFISIGTITTVISITTGTIKSYFLGLPIIFYSSFFEMGFLTFTIILFVKDIYTERNKLSEKIAVQQKQFLNAFMKGEDRERKRISKELHDNIGSKLGYLKRLVSDKFNDDSTNNTIDSICDDVRNLSHDISPSELKLVGLESAVSDLSKQISTQTSLNVDFYSYHFPDNLNEETSTQLYRIIQEAFNNIIKHAEAKNIDLQLVGHENYATINIEDDGIGFDTSNKKRGLGLKNMTSRAQQLNGTLSIDSQPTIGTSLLITFPT